MDDNWFKSIYKINRKPIFGCVWLFKVYYEICMPYPRCICNLKNKLRLKLKEKYPNFTVPHTQKKKQQSQKQESNKQ